LTRTFIREHHRCRMPLSDCRILIVEDDEEISRALGLLLAHLNAKVRVAKGVDEAIRALAWDPRCLLLDLMLPDGDGTLVLREVRERGLTARVAVTTGSDDEGRLAPVRRLGADRIFAKPVEWATMLEWIKGACLARA
jgi:DNA-binding response OmpR family regulator